ncbi:MAG TPA: hypothetical protein VHW96_10080 [Solirubrobacteraceae bacterium]|nr:hypothetical protein [Solirubrobacteraceae bacterium]
MRLRASHGIVAILGVVMLGWMGVSVAGAATSGTPKQIAIADGPRGALLGVLDDNGNVWAKYLDASAWTLEYPGGQTQMAIADGPHGPVIGRLDSGGTFWAKAGSLDSPWVQEQTGTRQIAVADGDDGPMAGYVDDAGTFYAKLGGLSAEWTHMYGGGSLDTVSAIALADGGGPDYGALTSSGAFLAKTGANSAWTTEGSDIGQIGLADGPDGATLGMLDGTGIFSAKTGGTAGTLVNEYSGGQTAIVVGDGPHGPLLGRLDSTGTFSAKDGSMSAAWTDEFNGGQKLIAVADGSDGPVLGRVDATGAFYAKSGGLSTAWQLEYSPAPASPTASPTPPPPTQVTQTTPVPKAPGAIRARFAIRWHLNRRGTVVRYVHLVSGLPQHGRVSIRCVGHHCPRIRATATGPHAIVKMLARLAGRRFGPGERLLITVTASGRRPERIELRFRPGHKPLARLLSS